MNIELVPIWGIDVTFPKCSEFLTEALRKGNGTDLNLHGLYAECRSGSASLFISTKGGIVTNAMVLRFEQHTDGSAARVLAFGGVGGEDWLLESKAFHEKFIKPYTSRLIFEGRKGWERKLDNVKVRSVAYEMELH